MANIKAFRAIRQRIDNQMVEMDLQAWLEPGLNYGGNLKPYLATYKRLLKDGLYLKEEGAAIYVYENQSSCGSQKGIWALTNIKDSKNGTIVLHEQTLPEHEDKIKAYREYIGLEGDPILLTYYSQCDINQLIDKVMACGVPEITIENGTVHRLWKLTDSRCIEEFQKAFAALSTVYLADGHHRLAAAANLETADDQWISSLYISTDQLRIREFNRLVIPDTNISGEALFDLIHQHFHVSELPDNAVCLPTQIHRLGMCFKGAWYHLELKSDQAKLEQQTDTEILQDYILGPFFGIKDPRTDPRLRTFSPDKGWDKLLKELKKNENSIAFSLFPITVEQFISRANMQKPLPPKSTWIEPKIPYGLLMYCSR